MKRQILLSLVTAAAIAAARPAAAQSTYHILPQFADGKLPDGTSYRSTLQILPATNSSAPACSFVLWGMAASFDVGASGYYFDAAVPAGMILSAPTSGV